MCYNLQCMGKIKVCHFVKVNSMRGGEEPHGSGRVFIDQCASKSFLAINTFVVDPI